jgi:hypothetical protein
MVSFIRKGAEATHAPGSGSPNTPFVQSIVPLTAIGAVYTDPMPYDTNPSQLHTLFSAAQTLPAVALAAQADALRGTDAFEHWIVLPGDRENSLMYALGDPSVTPTNMTSWSGSNDTVSSAEPKPLTIEWDSPLTSQNPLLHENDARGVQ